MPYFHVSASADNNVEREVTDNLIAEVTRESPFMDDDNFDQVMKNYHRKKNRFFGEKTSLFCAFYIILLHTVLGFPLGS